MTPLGHSTGFWFSGSSGGATFIAATSGAEDEVNFGTVTIPEPTGAAQGDMMAVVIYGNLTNGNPYNSGTPRVPTGTGWSIRSYNANGIILTATRGSTAYASLKAGISGSGSLVAIGAGSNIYAHVLTWGVIRGNTLTADDPQPNNQVQGNHGPYQTVIPTASLAGQGSLEVYGLASLQGNHTWPNQNGWVTVHNYIAANRGGTAWMTRTAPTNPTDGGDVFVATDTTGGVSGSGACSYQMLIA